MLGTRWQPTINYLSAALLIRSGGQRNVGCCALSLLCLYTLYASVYVCVITEHSISIPRSIYTRWQQLVCLWAAISVWRSVACVNA